MPERDADGNWIPFDPGAKPSPLDLRDYRLADHHPDIVRAAAFYAFPPAFSLRQYDPGVDDQGQIGSCTAFGSGNAHELTQQKQGLTLMRGSKLAQYYWTRQIEGTTAWDSGAYVRDAIKALANTGYAPVADWPYNVQYFSVQPASKAFLDAPAHKALKYVAVPNDVASIKAAIYSGYAVIVGFTVYQNFFNPVNGIIPWPSGSVAGGHCVRLIGWDDSKNPLFGGTAWEFPNSWSTAWGVGGYAWLPSNILQSLGSDFWLISEVMGSAPIPPPPVPPVPPTPVKTAKQVNVEVIYTDGTKKTFGAGV